MKANEAIKYLQQLYPNGGHCWLDEQQTEAIDMAIAALNKKEVSVDYDKLKEQLHNTLAKETKESLNEFLDEEECNITGIGVREKVTGKLREMLDKKDYRERYKRIAESEQFKKTHEGISIGEVMHIEGEEPVSKQSVDEAMAEVEQKIQSFTQAHVGENADEILAHMRGEKPVSEEFEKAATKYAEKKCFLENAVYTDGEMLMAKAKPRFDFYDIATAFEDGAKWQKRKDNQPVSEDEIEKQFKAGDVVMYVSRHPAYSGLYLLGNPNDLSIGYSNADEPYQIALRNCTAASEDERRQFMRELNNNGYKWNECTLKIEKKEEPVSEELGNYINELSKQFPEVSFAKLSRIAVRVAKWQKEQMMAKAIDGTARPDDNEIWCNLTSNNLEDGDKVKVIVVKED